MIADMLLVWVFWVNVRLTTLEEIERRKHMKTFAEIVAASSPIELLMTIPLVLLLGYVVICFFSLIGACGETEILFYRWLILQKSVVVL